MNSNTEKKAVKPSFCKLVLDNHLIIFFTLMWYLSLVAWIYFAVTGNNIEMWLSNAFMWLAIIGKKVFNNN